MTHDDHLIAIALGAPHEPAGIVALHRTEQLGAWDDRRKRYAVTASYAVTSISAEARGDSYGGMLDHVLTLVPKLTGRQRLAVLVDVTTSGRAVLELFRDNGLKPVPVMVASAIGTKAAGRHVQVGEAELVARIGIVFGEDRVLIDPKQPCARELLAQLNRHKHGARPERTPSAMQPFKPAERVELVRALSIGLWWGDRMMPPRVDQPRPPPVAIDCRPPTFSEAMALGRRVS